MHLIEDADLLRGILPGRWTITATNFPMWLTGERRQPTFEYGVLRDDPLVLSDVVSYTDAAGKVKTIRGKDRWRGHHFTWRGAGPLSLVTSNWAVIRADEDLVTLRFEKSLASPAGVDIIAREGMDSSGVRAFVAADPAAFGLTIEEFASLTWLDQVPPAS